MGRRLPAPAGRVAERAARRRGALQRFLGHLSSRNSAPGTIGEYRRHASEFLAFLAARGVDWKAPDRATVRAYLGTLADRGLSASTVGGQLAAIRSLYRHAARQGWIEGDPVAGVRHRASPGGCPASCAWTARRAWSRRRPDTCRHAARRRRALAEATARRDAALLELLYATGMRISELASLTVDRLDLARRRLRVIGKGARSASCCSASRRAPRVHAYLASGGRRWPPGRRPTRRSS